MAEKRRNPFPLDCILTFLLHDNLFKNITCMKLPPFPSRTVGWATRRTFHSPGQGTNEHSFISGHCKDSPQTLVDSGACSHAFSNVAFTWIRTSRLHHVLITRRDRLQLHVLFTHLFAQEIAHILKVYSTLSSSSILFIQIPNLNLP